jgi:hypothetical protein
VRRQADHGAATRLLGVIAHRLGDLDRAERLLRKAIRFGQESPELLGELGRVFIDKKQWDNAASCFERSLELFPEYAEAFINLGFTMNAKRDLVAAKAVYQRGLVAFPDNVDLWTNLATLQRESGELDESIKRLNEMEARFGFTAALQESRGRAWLQLRRWSEGWTDYEARLRIDGPTKVSFDTRIPRWNGESIDGKHMLVLCEQGIGDEVQFASCFLDLVRTSGKCTLTCSPRLESIYRRSFPTANVLPLSDQERLSWQPIEPASFDFVVAAGSLPRFFRNSDDAFPQEPYLVADEPEVQRYRETSNPLRVGVSWWGCAIVSQMQQRSIPFEVFSNLLSIPNVQFVNLQHGRCDEKTAKGELARFSSLRTYDEINPYIDLDSWFNLIASLDLVITVDNSNAHFAGALGVPTWLLLPERPNWRWPYDVEQSHWYRAVHFFRQSIGGDWAPTIERVCQQLRTCFKKGSDPLKR